VYLENAPAYAELEENFAWEKTYTAERARREREEPVFQWVGRRLIALRGVVFPKRGLLALTARLVPDGDVLDVGCSDATMLSRLEPRHVPHGIELSAALAKRAADVVAPRGGSIIHASALEGLARFSAGRFSGIWMHSFLEHELNPLGTLQAAARVLQPDGRLILKMPNYASINRHVRGARWCGFRFPDHVNYFTPASLTRMVHAAGLHVVRMSFRDRLPTSDNMWLVAGPVAR
jgi:SAM-dependent methyltransferase